MKQAKNRAYNVIVINKHCLDMCESVDIATSKFYILQIENEHFLTPMSYLYKSHAMITKQYHQKFMIQPCGLKNTLLILLAKRIKK